MLLHIIIPALLGTLFICLGALNSVNAAKKTVVPAPVSVEVASVMKQDIPIDVYSVGSLVAIQAVSISSEVDGRVKKVFFNDGAQVEQEAPLLKLDSGRATADQALGETRRLVLTILNNAHRLTY